jgi:preprotein translocase SecE subunit
VQIYKEGHGVLVRRTAFAALAGLSVWGGMTLYDALVQTPLKKLTLSDYVVPVIGQRPDIAALICWVSVGLTIWWLFKLLNREKYAEYLIETDVEFRKVTWPTWNDAFNSALVVLVFIVILTTLITIFDFSLSKLMGFVL